MSGRSNRLPADAPHGFGGSAIDRSRPIRFRLDGRTIDGFGGDSVLSAVLAAGITAVGTHQGGLVALDARSAPPVVPVGRGRSIAEALPMARTPAIDGASLATVGRRPAWWRRAVRRSPADSFDLILDEQSTTSAPWLHHPPEETLRTDWLVIGAGVAGLGAASAVSARQRVMVVDRRADPGGVARFFGSVEGEDPPEEAIARLTQDLAARPRAETLLSAEVFALTGTSALVHQVEMRDGLPRGRVIRIEAKQVVIATGSVERLPVFAGNRLPGVSGALAGFEIATRHGVWLGRRAVFATPHNFAYRLAQHADAAGIEVGRIADPRIAPRSRYIDFCKASGLPLASGVAVNGAVRDLRTGRLRIDFAVAIEDIAQDATSLEADQLVAAGGWQPELSLWMMSGGEARWDRAQSWFAPAGSVPDVALAGAVTGLRGTAAAIRSGEAAVAALSGRAVPALSDRVVDAIYESADAPTPIAPARETAGAAYLDGGLTLTTLDAAAPRRGGPRMIARAVGYSIGDIAAAVALGAVAEAEAGAIAAERCVFGGEIVNRAWRVEAVPAETGPARPPAYLRGRFGPSPRICILAVADGRRFEPGCLVFASSDSRDPLRAIGVVYAPAPGGRSGGLALLGEAPAEVGATVFVRDAGGTLPAQVMDRLRPEGSAR